MSRNKESRSDEQFDETRSLSTCPDVPAAADSDEDNSQPEVPAHVAAPAAAAAPADQPTIDPVTLMGAAKEMAAFWPFVLRFAMLVGADAVMSFVIAQKELDLLGAYAAYRTIISLACGMLFASIFPVVTLMSEARGEEDDAVEKNDEAKIAAAQKKIQSIWRQGVIFSVMLSVPAVALGCTASPLFEKFKQPEVVVRNARDFLLYASPGFVADLFYRLTARAASGLGVKKSILVADTLDRILEIGFAYAFLNGKFGLPELGLPGVAAAYSISKAITFLAHLAYIYASPTFLNFDYTKYELFACNGPFYNKAIMKQLVGAGIPDGLSAVASGVSGLLVTMFCGQSGTESLVGLQLASVYSGFANFHASAVLNAACSKIGRFFAILSNEENKYTAHTVVAASQNVKMYAKILFGVYMATASIACALAFLIPRRLATLLIDENNSAHQLHLSTAITFLKIQGVAEFLRGLEMPASCTLESLLDNKFILFATILFDLMMNPGAAAAARFGLHKDSSWVFAAANLGFALMTLVCMLRVVSKLSALPMSEEAVAANAPVSSAEQAAHIVMPAEARQSSEKSCLRRLMFWSSEQKKETNLAAAEPLLAPC